MTPKTDSVAVLRECPFCGGSAAIAHRYDEDDCHWAKVRCNQCGAESRGKWASSSANACPLFYAEVRDEWNRRHPAPPGSDAVTEEECEAAVETFASQPSGSYDEGCEARLMRAVLEQFLAARTGKGEA